MSPFESFKNNRVTLVKNDGTWFEDLPASVKSGLIFAYDRRIPIEDGDQFERRLPSGIIEVFTVVDAGFHQRFHSIPSHYQSNVRKNTAAPLRSRSASIPQVVYNLTGPNPRVNIQSSDLSTNVVNVESGALFDSLREAIQEFSMDSPASRRLIQDVDTMESAVGTNMFAESYGEFVAAADHMTLVAPVLPALTQLLLQK